MKRVVLMIIPALICGLLHTSCNKENNANSALNIKAIGFLSETATKRLHAEEFLKTDTLLFSGDNILWYNSTTSEIKFKTAPNGDYFMSVFGGLVSIIVCLGDTELFALDAVPSISSVSLGHPVLIEFLPNGYYIGRGYPNWEYWTEEFWTKTGWEKPTEDCEYNWVKDREQNWKAIEQGWNKFIAQLKKEGKYRK